MTPWGARVTAQAVAVHCMLGHGRTGTMLACYLVKTQKMSGSDAIREIRRLRPGSIETREQEQAVMEFHRRFRYVQPPLGGSPGQQGHGRHSCRARSPTETWICLIVVLERTAGRCDCEHLYEQSVLHGGEMFPGKLCPAFVLSPLKGFMLLLSASVWGTKGPPETPASTTSHLRSTLTCCHPQPQALQPSSLLGTQQWHPKIGDPVSQGF